MKAAIYVRVSTLEQAQHGFSIRGQHERCLSFVQSQGWDVERIITDDGQSAKNLDRPGMQELIEGVKNKEFDVVVVYRLDRMVRNVFDLHQLLNMFDEHGCSFKSVTEVFDTTTAMGRFFITIVGAMASWERENLAERVKMGMSRMVKEGRWHGGRTPYGYMYDGKQLVVHDEEASVVKMIFDKYTNGIGAGKICRDLNEQGYKPRKAKIWDVSLVHQVLKNPAYMGKFRYQGELHDVYGLSIISEHQFETAQKIRKARADKHPRRSGGKYIFSGMLRCARCGSRLNGKYNTSRTNEYYTYVCAGKNNGICDLPSLNEKYVEEQFIMQLEEIASEYEAQSQVAMEEQVEEEKIRDDIERQINSIKKRRKKWQEAFANDVITLDELKERTADDNEQLQELEQQLHEIQEKEEDVSNVDILTVTENWSVLSKEDKKVTVEVLAEKIIVNAENGVMGRGRKRKMWIDDIFFL
ncbi:site-specific DNA recombinase [Alteribacillus persepolensis]|uniref:Site-specific DNA recombinase n=2 Tax=Alteribacillus persepolensis TaxID=568899 RepID=A0A1G8I6G3_9BACI|nr:recombinase family protein [Alteribacillus persepolensis]SDI14180.1 site-specific DNA recombinase [Alteribacillus persepolensis]